MEPSTSLLRLLSERPRFRVLFLADALSAIGDWLTYVAVGLLALTGPHGLVGVALVQMAHAVPQAIASPLAGWLTDRVDRRRLLVIASLARGSVTVAMAFAASRGAVAWVEGLLFLRMAGAAFILAPSRAVLPQLVEVEELEPANRLLGTSWAVLFTMGVALGGVVTGAFGPTTALAVDAATFAVAALIFTGLGALPPARAEAGADTSLAADARAHPDRVVAALAKAPTLFVNGGAWVILHALVGASAGAAYGLGGLHAVRGIGNGAGPWFLRRLGPRRMVALGGLATGVAVMILSLDGAIAWATGCALWGIGVGATWVGGTVWLQERVPAPVLGRYAALDVGAASGASASGGLVAALLCAFAPVWVAACVLAAVGVLGVAALYRAGAGEQPPPPPT
ncbi:MAG: MFS transporter [Sandaracinaceae bacterium]|nr:MFS transporter [Sandaracinaceae bacterium]